MIVSIIFEFSFDHIKFVSPKSYQLKNDPALSKNYEFTSMMGRHRFLSLAGFFDAPVRLC